MNRIFFLLYFLLIFLLNFYIFSNNSRKIIVNRLFKEVEYWMGTPYVYGGYSKSGIDCSGFTSNVYKKIFNIDLPRSVSEQKLLGKPVTGKLQPGDLVFFITVGNKVSHVGIYVFDDKFIHAASDGPQLGVIKSSLNEKYYKTRYVYARRIVDIDNITINDELIAINNNDRDNKKIENQNNKTNNKQLENSISNKTNDSKNDYYKNTNEEKDLDKENSEENLFRFEIGNVIFNDKLYKIGDIFDRERFIIIELENILLNERNVVIYLSNNDNTKKIYIFDFKKENIIRKKIYLPAGNWLISLQNSKGFVYKQKEINIM